MLQNSVKLAVSATVPMECEFSTEDEGWKGTCPQLSVTVRGSNLKRQKSTWKRRCKRRLSLFFVIAKWQRERFVE